jgi:hypothetical protein
MVDGRGSPQDGGLPAAVGEPIRGQPPEKPRRLGL